MVGKMEFMLKAPDCSLPERINYREKLLFIGSCFTEHMGTHLQNLKFRVLQNPNGILFDPASVASCLVYLVENRKLEAGGLFFHQERWQSWQHHSVFASTSRDHCLEKIHHAQEEAHVFLRDARWLVITLGSAFSYRLRPGAPADCRNTNEGPAGEVANCHRAPAQWFDKILMPVDEIHAQLDLAIHRLMQFNPGIRIIFTVSPVRHVRDGVVENNRSKARLLEVVHHLCHKFERIYYFPAYELMIDVLRDYRFYDVDMVHPNYQGTAYVLDHFESGCLDEESRELLSEMKKISLARKHRPAQPDTASHRHFLQTHYEKVLRLQERFPELDLQEEMAYFSIR